MLEYPTPGSSYELFGFIESEVVLMDYDVGWNIRLLSWGKFSINLFMHMTYPILTVFCSVAGFDWPLAKDTVVIRMAKRTFAIALPGLLYGLQFPWYCPEALFGRLIRMFQHYTLYMDIDDNNQGYLVMDNEQGMWNKLRPQIEPMADEALKKLGHFPGISQFHILDLNSCFMRAIRMSTITRLIIESMSIGKLKGSQFKITGVNPYNQAYRSRAYASVSSFSGVVDAIELAWVLSSGFGHLLRGGSKPLGACDLKFKLWCLNEEGIMAFLHRWEPIIEKEEKLKAKDETEASAVARNKGKLIIP